MFYTTLRSADVVSIPGVGRSPGGGNGNQLQFLPGKSRGQRSLTDSCPWSRKESNTTEHSTTIRSTSSQYKWSEGGSFQT